MILNFADQFPGVNNGSRPLVPSPRWKICDILSPEIEKSISQTLVGGLQKVAF